MILQAGLVAFFAIGLLPCFVDRGESLNVTLGSWLVFRSGRATGLRLFHHFDALTVLFLLAVCAAVLLTPLFRSSRTDADDRVPRDTWRFAFLQAALQFVLAGDFVVQVGFLQLMSVCCLLWTVRNDRAPNSEIVSARRTFLFRLAGNGFLLLGVMLILLPGVRVIAEHESAAGPFAMDSAGEAAATAIGVLLLLGFFCRAVAFPFFGPEQGTGGSREVRTYGQLIVAPAAILLLMRTRPYFVASSVVENGMLLSGAGLALLAGIVAASRSRGGNSNVISLALTGMMLAGVGSGTAAGIRGAAVLFLSHAVVFSLWRENSANRDESDSYAEPVAGRSTDWAIALGMALLGLGLAGQGLILIALVPSGAAMIVMGIAQTLTSFALGRRWRVTRTRNGERGRGSNGNLGPSVPHSALRAPSSFAASLTTPPAIAAALALMLLAGLLVVSHGMPVGMTWPETTSDGFILEHLPEFLLFALAGAIGLTLGWMTASGGESRAFEQRKFVGRLRSAVGSGLHLEDCFLLAVVLPLRGVAQLCRFLEWFIIERFWDLPRRLTELLWRIGEPLQPGTLRFSVLTVLLATAALLGVIIGLGN